MAWVCGCCYKCSILGSLVKVIDSGIDEGHPDVHQIATALTTLTTRGHWKVMEATALIARALLLQTR